VLVVPHSEVDARVAHTRNIPQRGLAGLLSLFHGTRLDIVLDLLPGNVREHGWFDMQHLY
jgi:hypothetical protein